MDGDELLVGFRFYPTEEELLCYYLSKKLNGSSPAIDAVIPVVHIYDYSPRQLPQLAGAALCHEDTEQWFFFTPMQEREARGGRTNRLTQTGYWKATGSPSDVYTSQRRRIGRKRTMVFYEGRAPNGTKTCWKMNEYKLYHHSMQLKEELSLCRIYKRSNRTRAFYRRPQIEAAVHDQEAVHYDHHHHHHSTATTTTPTSDEALATTTATPTTTDEALATTFIHNHQNIIDSSTDPDWETQFNWDSNDVATLLDWFDI